MLSPAPKNDSVCQTRMSVTSNTLQHLSVGFSIALARRERQRSMTAMTSRVENRRSGCSLPVAVGVLSHDPPQSGLA